MSSDKEAERKLRIGKFLISTGVNGPGRRFVIWFQGCRFHCRGCFNPEFFNEEKGVLMSVDEIAAHIDLAAEIEGVTFTGGEPFLQAKELLPLAKWIKSKGLSLVCYTGYLFEDIPKGSVPYAKGMLRWIDILIDGQYKEEEKVPLLWRGSNNQRVYFLTDRYKNLEPLTLREGMREVEVQVGNNWVIITGIFEIGMWEKLKRKIDKLEKS
jgi:anaerobic ribonucleoside-triphosphate reductase activating protein